MDVDPPNETTPRFRRRLVEATIPLLLALFLGSLTFGVWNAKVAGAAVLGLLLKGFFAAVVGGIAAFSLGIAVQTLRGRRARRRAMPLALASFCPRCGARSDAERAACPGCAHPFTSRATRWSTPEHNYGATLLGLVLGGGLACLGAFLAAGPFLEGERRVWALLAALALGLLLLAVGALMVWGGALAGLDDLRGFETWSYEWSGASGERETAAGEASALLRRGVLVHASGSSSGEASVLARDGSALELPLGRLPRDGQSFVKALTVLYHAGLLGMWYSERLEWRLGDPTSRRATAKSTAREAPLASARETLQVCLIERPPNQELLPLLELLAPRIKSSAYPVSELWRAVQADAEVTRRFDEFFRERELASELLEGRAAGAVTRVIGARLLN